MAAPTAIERAWRIHSSVLLGYRAEEGSLDGIERIEDMIDWCNKEEPQLLNYWNEVRDEYIKIKELNER